ncbi:hypothetical protein [Leeia sp.]|uniref:hypothetical protein n=1 Tax=Leeia sp. TaxID=2884678 RepID=UPI0035B362E6
MNFSTFNQPWIQTLTANKSQVLASGGVAKARAFLDRYQGDAWQLLPLQLVMPESDYQVLSEAAKALLSAQTRLLRHMMATEGRSGIMHRFQISEEMAALMNWDELVKGEHLVSRFDILPHADGYVFCEMNVDPSVGGAELFECGQMALEALGLDAMNSQVSPCLSRARLVQHWVQQRQLTRVVVFGLQMYDGDDFPSFDLEQEQFSALLPGVQVDVVDEYTFPDELLQPGAGKHVLIYRIGVYEDMTPFCRQQFARMLASGATIINAMESEIRMDKSWFSLFHQPRWHTLLSPAEQSAIRRFVPYTFALTESKLHAVVEERAHYVFKLNQSYGGAGVLMGDEHSAEDLLTRLQAVPLAQWTVQQRVQVSSLTMPADEAFESVPHQLVLGLFMMDTQPGGLWVRASRHSQIVNVSQGSARVGWAVPMTVEERDRQLAMLAGLPSEAAAEPCQ